MPRTFTGLIIEWIYDNERHEKERVLWQAADYSSIVVISLSFPSKSLPFFRPISELEEALQAETAIITPTDPYYYLAAPPIQFLSKHETQRDISWEIIKELVSNEPGIYVSDTRGLLAMKAANKFNITKGAVYKYLRNYWVRGKIKNALLPAFYNCGAPGADRIITSKHDEPEQEETREANEKADLQPKRGRPSDLLKKNSDAIGINVTEEIKNIFRISIRLFYRNKKYNIKETHQRMCEKFFNLGYTEDKTPILPPAHLLITYEQFYYWFKKEINIIDCIIFREGRRVYELTARPILGNSTVLAFGPGSIFQIDATIADIYLVWEIDRTKIIGRPVVYFCIDAFSRMIVGLYVGLEGPSWLSAMMALDNTMTDKVEFCAKYGTTIDSSAWPCCYLPSEFLADRGEFLSYNSDTVVDALGCRLANCPPYRGDWKGIVESNFGISKAKAIKWVPGEVRQRSPGEKDHRLDATLDLRDFIQILIHYVLERNNSHRLDSSTYIMEKDMLRDGVEPIPVELWNWGLVNRSGHLRQKSSDAVKLALMPQIDATVTERGIRANGMYYSCDLAIQEQWFTRARRGKSWKIRASYHPREINYIYLIMGKDSPLKCRRLADLDDENERFHGCCLEDVQEYFELDKLTAKTHKSADMQSAARLNKAKDEIVRDAKRKTKLANAGDTASKSHKTKAIGQNRKKAAQLLSDKEKWVIDNRKNSGNSAPAEVINFQKPSVSTLEKTKPAKDRIFDLIVGIEQSTPDIKESL